MKKEKRKRQKGEDNDINETKNIPKNYGKAMLSFIQKNLGTYKDLITPILTELNLTLLDFINFLKKHKRGVNSINYLKFIWGYQG